MVSELRMDLPVDPGIDLDLFPEARMGPRDEEMDGIMMQQPEVARRSLDQLGFMSSGRREEMQIFENVFHGFGVRVATLAKMAEMGFTVSTLMYMTETELDNVIQIIFDTYHLEPLLGERFGIKSAIRAENKRLHEELKRQRLELLTKSNGKRKLDDVAPVATSSKKGAINEQRIGSGSARSHRPVHCSECKLQGTDSWCGRRYRSSITGLLASREDSYDSEEAPDGRRRETNQNQKPREGHGELAWRLFSP